MTEEKTKDNEEHIFSPSSSNELSQPVSPQLSEIELSQFQQDVRLPGFATPSYQGRPQQQLNDVSLEVAARPTTLGLLVTRGPLASHLYRPAEQELKWRRQQQQECWSELVAKTSTPDWRTLLHPKNLETVDRYFQDRKAIVLQRPYELSSGRDIVSSFMSRLTEAATYAEMQPWCWAPWNEIVVLIRAFLKHSMVKVEANPDLGFMGLQADPLETFNQTYLDMLIQQDADLGYQIINSPGFEKTRGELFNERINPFRALSECDKNLRNTQVYEMASVVALKRIPGPNTTLEQLFAEADSVRASGISSAYTDQYWIWSIIFGITNASSWLGNPLMAGSLAQRAWKKIEADLLLPGNHPRKISPIQHEPCHLASAGVSRPPLQYSTVRDILLGPCYGYYIDGTTRPSAELSLAVDLIPQRFQDDAKSHLEANKSNCAACHLSKEDANNSNVVAKKGKRNILSLKQENEPTIKRAKLQAIGTKENSSRSVPASFVQSHDIARFPGRATNNLRKFQERAENALEWEQALDRASPANPPRVSSQCLVGVFRNPAKNKALLSKLIEKPEFIPRFAPRTSIGEGDNPCEVAEHLIRLEKNLCFVCGEPSGREHGKTCPDRVAWRNFQTQIILERGQHYFNDIMNKARKDIVVSLLERCDKPTFAGCQERIVEEISPDCDQDFQLGPDHLEIIEETNHAFLVPLKFDEEQVEVLIDTGATINIICSKLSQKLKAKNLAEEQGPSTLVRVGNQAVVKTGGIMLVQFSSSLEQYQDVFYPLDKPLATVILGMPFLAKHNTTLSPRNKRVLFPSGDSWAVLPHTQHSQYKQSLSTITTVTTQVAWNREMKLLEQEKLPPKIMYFPWAASLKVEAAEVGGEMDLENFSEPSSAFSTPNLSDCLDQKVASQIYQEYEAKGLFRETPPPASERKGLRSMRIDLTPQGERDPPCFSPYPASEADREIIEKTVSDLKEAGIIADSNSPFGAPCLVVRVTGKKPRLVIDYRGLNAVTVRDSHPIADIEVTTRRLGTVGPQGCFTAIDLVAGFHQLPVVKEHRYRTAFVTEYGAYEWNNIPMGLRNAPAFFSRVVTDVLRSFLFRCVVVYVDDIVIYSPNLDQHARDVREVFDALLNAGLKVKGSKTHMFRAEIEFLGQVVGRLGVRMSEKKISALRDFPDVMSGPEEVSRFIGLANWTCRRFIPWYGVIVKPLFRLMKTSKKTKMTADQWKRDWEANNGAATAAVKKLKELLASPRILMQPRHDQPFFGAVDAATRYGLGGVLVQKDPSSGLYRALGYYSRAMTSAEMKRPPQEQELLAVVMFLDHFRSLLTARTITILTDHESLPGSFHTLKLSPKIHRWQDFMSLFDIRLKYVAGARNIVADALSRCGLKDDWLLQQKATVSSMETCASYLQFDFLNAYVASISEVPCLCSGAGICRKCLTRPTDIPEELFCKSSHFEPFWMKTPNPHDIQPKAQEAQEALRVALEEGEYHSFSGMAIQSMENGSFDVLFDEETRRRPAWELNQDQWDIIRKLSSTPNGISPATTTEGKSGGEIEPRWLMLSQDSEGTWWKGNRLYLPDIIGFRKALLRLIWDTVETVFEVSSLNTVQEYFLQRAWYPKRQLLRDLRAIECSKRIERKLPTVALYQRARSPGLLRLVRRATFLVSQDGCLTLEKIKTKLQEVRQGGTLISDGEIVDLLPFECDLDEQSNLKLFQRPGSLYSEDNGALQYKGVVFVNRDIGLQILRQERPGLTWQDTLFGDINWNGAHTGAQVNPNYKVQLRRRPKELHLLALKVPSEITLITDTPGEWYPTKLWALQQEDIIALLNTRTTLWTPWEEARTTTESETEFETFLTAEELERWHKDWGHPQDDRLIVSLVTTLGFNKERLQKVMDLWRAISVKCSVCQAVKPKNRKIGLSPERRIPLRPFSRIQIDFVTGLPPQKFRGQKCDAVLTIIDVTTRFVLLIASSTKWTTLDTIQAILAHLVPLVGWPEYIESDRDIRFQKTWTDLVEKFSGGRTKVLLSSGYEHGTTAIVERSHRSLESILRTWIHDTTKKNKHENSWTNLLPEVAAVLNATRIGSLGASPAQLVFRIGLTPRIMREIPLFPVLSSLDRETWEPRVANRALASLRSTINSSANRLNRHRSALKLRNGDSVYIHRSILPETIIARHQTRDESVRGTKLDLDWIGPVKVVGRRNRLGIEVDLGNDLRTRISDVIHAKNLKRAAHLAGPLVYADSNQYEVEKIVDETSVSGIRYYRVRWLGYQSEDDTWENKDALDGLEALANWLKLSQKKRKELSKGLSKIQEPCPSQRLLAIMTFETPTDCGLPEESETTNYAKKHNLVECPGMQEQRFVAGPQIAWNDHLEQLGISRKKVAFLNVKA